MWNQNGNGSGDAYDRLNNARPISNRDPYIEEGQHTLAVISIEEFQSEMGMAIRARFLVLESQAMKPDTTVGAVWFLQKPTPKPGMVSDSDRFADFCTRLKGAPAGHPIGADIRVLVKERAAEQLARGMVVRAYGIKKVAKTTGKPFTVVNWTHVEQTPAQIAQMRAQIEAKGLVQENRGTGGGQFQGAPHPSQGPVYPGTPTNAPAAPAGGWGQPAAAPPAPVGTPWGNPQGGSGGQGGW